MVLNDNGSKSAPACAQKFVLRAKFWLLFTEAGGVYSYPCFIKW
jgi:hypothetical protein